MSLRLGSETEAKAPRASRSRTVLANINSIWLSPDYAAASISMTLDFVSGRWRLLLFDVGRLAAVVLLFVVVAWKPVAFEQALLLLFIVWAASLLAHLLVIYRICPLRRSKDHRD